MSNRGSSWSQPQPQLRFIRSCALQSKRLHPSALTGSSEGGGTRELGSRAHVCVVVRLSWLLQP